MSVQAPPDLGESIARPLAGQNGQQYGMDAETSDALVLEGWTPPGQVPALLTLENVAEQLRMSLPAVLGANARGELPRPDALIGSTPVWLVLTIGKYASERPTG
jgi:hypothetical protein